MVFHIKMRLCNESYTSFQSWSRGQSRGWSKGPFKPLTPLSLWPGHKRGLQIILMCNQIIFSVENQWEVWRGRSWRLSTAVNTALCFPSLFWWEQNEKKNTAACKWASIAACSAIIPRSWGRQGCSLGGYSGWKKSTSYSISCERQETQLESLQVSPRHLWPSRFQWRELKKREGEETLKSWLFPQRRFRNPEISFTKACVHMGDDRKENIANISCGQRGVNWLCEPIVRKCNIRFLLSLKTLTHTSHDSFS